MVPNQSKVVIEPKSAPAEWDSSKRQSIDGRSTIHITYFRNTLPETLSAGPQPGFTKE